MKEKCPRCTWVIEASYWSRTDGKTAICRHCATEEALELTLQEQSKKPGYRESKTPETYARASRGVTPQDLWPIADTEHLVLRPQGRFGTGLPGTLVAKLVRVS
jgi:hypothetical protein